MNFPTVAIAALIIGGVGIGAAIITSSWFGRLIALGFWIGGLVVAGQVYWYGIVEQGVSFESGHAWVNWIAALSGAGLLLLCWPVLLAQRAPHYQRDLAVAARRRSSPVGALVLIAVVAAWGWLWIW